MPRNPICSHGVRRSECERYHATAADIAVVRDWEHRRAQPIDSGHHGGGGGSTDYSASTAKTAMADLRGRLRQMGGRPDYRLVDMQKNAGGWSIVPGGKTYVRTRHQDRVWRSEMMVDWLLRHRPDLFTPSQHEAARLFFIEEVPGSTAARQLGITRRAFMDRIERVERLARGYEEYRRLTRDEPDRPHQEFQRFERVRPKKGRPETLSPATAGKASR